jgi:hypothetical protein
MRLSAFGDVRMLKGAIRGRTARLLQTADQ